MLTKHVSKLMDYVPGFVGVFACDKIPDFKSNISMIINTDKSSEPGEHWVAIYIGRNTIYFFDSIGRDIDGFSDPFRTYIKNMSRDFKVKVESRLLQNFLSNTCGYWCVYYIFCRTCRIDRFYKYFTDDLYLNEKILEYFFEYFDSL